MADSSVVPSIISAVSGLIGTIIGGVITYWVQRAQRRSDRDEDRRALAAGIAAEIEAYVDLVTQRDHANHARQIAVRLRRGEDIKLSVFTRANLTTRELFPLFYSNLEKIGLLGDVAFDLGRFYTMIAGVIATIDQLATGKFDGLAIQERAALIEREVDLWENALRVGRALCPRLKALI